jgi:hypothetical protein
LASQISDYNGSRTVDFDPKYYYYYRYQYFYISSNIVYWFDALPGNTHAMCTLSTATGVCDANYRSYLCGGFGPTSFYDTYSPTVNGLMVINRTCDNGSPNTTTRIIPWLY